MKQYKNRDEVEEKYKWDLSEFFESNESFYKTCDEIEKKIPSLQNYVGCSKDANKLYEYLIKSKEIETVVEKILVYAIVKNDDELGKQENIELDVKRQNIVMKFNDATAFFKPELLSLSKDEFDKLINSPKLEEYKIYLERIYREKEHILDEESEKLINKLVSATNNFSTISSTLLNSEHNYGNVKISNKEKVKLTTTNARVLQTNDNRKVRKEANTKLGKKALEYASTSASLLNGYVKLNDTLATIYKFKDNFEANLFDDNLNENIFNVLSKNIRENVSSLQEYFKLRKKILGLDTIYNYDLKAKLSNYKEEYSIEDAIKLIRKSFEVLGSEYLSKYDKVINNRHIDFCGYQGKCSGGYNITVPSCDSRILMSYNYDLDSVSTIAHEVGHHINHQFVHENNSYEYRHIPIITAEVASLTNEFLLLNYIYNNSNNKEEKIMALENSLNIIVSNLFGAVREGDMERLMYEKVHNGGSLTKEYMNEIAEESLKYYYGNTVKLNPYAKSSWIFRSHYYMDFYLYNYAICVSVASFFAKEISNGNKEILNKYLEFLKVGSNVWPIDVFKNLGISLESDIIYKNAISYFDELVSTLKSLY